MTTRMPANGPAISLYRFLVARVTCGGYILHLLQQSLIQSLLTPSSDVSIVHQHPLPGHRGLRAVVGTPGLHHSHGTCRPVSIGRT
jgi:hypothetical protein